jgi:hypothetical protein
MPRPSNPAPKNPSSTKKRKPTRKNTKVTGERSEAGFLYRASNPAFNFGIAKPWGDSRRYDFILDNGHRLHRVQVKCTESIRARAYETRATYTTGKGRAVYTKKDIDFIAAHVVPLDIWYIIPVEICTPAPMLRFYPHRQAKKMRLEPYREAWHLLQSEDDAVKIEIQASAADACVGADALVRPASETSPGLCGAGAPARELSNTNSDCHSERSRSENDGKSRNLLFPSAKKPVRLPKSAAPWPIPTLKMLIPRKGKHILPEAQEK